MSELTRLLEKAAGNLSGHPVKVRWRKPSRTDARAIAFKLGGVAMIDLHPGLSWEGDTLLNTICHESAHVKQLWDEWGKGIPKDYASGSITPPKWAGDLPGVKKTENDADEQTRRWLDYAEKNHMKHTQPGSDNDEFSLKIRALIDYGRR